MVLSDDLPTDSVLRRHAETERNRLLGLPPTDAVLRRHHAQWQAVRQGGRSPAGESARPAASPPGHLAAPVAATKPGPPRATEAPLRTLTPAAPAPAPQSGGLFGWLRRLLGA